MLCKTILCHFIGGELWGFHIWGFLVKILVSWMIVKLVSGGRIDIASEQGGNKEFHAVSSSADLLPTLENTVEKSFKHMQPMWPCILSDKQFEDSCQKIVPCCVVSRAALCQHKILKQDFMELGSSLDCRDCCHIFYKKYYLVPCDHFGPWPPPWPWQNFHVRAILQFCKVFTVSFFETYILLFFVCLTSSSAPIWWNASVR